MLTLFQWDLIMRHETPMGVGIVSGHRKLMEGTDIHTSPICHVEKAENNLQMKTASGNIYHLQMKEWRPRIREAETLDPELLGFPADFWAQCARVQEEASRAERADLQALTRPGTLFMRIVGTYILSAFWMGMYSRIRDTPIGIHLGMFQDSYLIRSAHEESAELDHVDLRLLPMQDRLEPYHVSEGIKSLQVRNEGCTDVAFGFEAKYVLCPSGTITSIPIRVQPCDSRHLELF